MARDPLALTERERAAVRSAIMARVAFLRRAVAHTSAEETAAWPREERQAHADTLAQRCAVLEAALAKLDPPREIGGGE